MHKILLVTVGGSPQPIITAIDSLQPQRVIFFCSDGAKGSKILIVGEGTPCEIRQGTTVVQKLPNIPTHLGLSNFQPDTDLVLIQNPDDLSECYQLTCSIIRKLRQDYSTSQIVADYTGGTKTMSVALAMAAIDYDNFLFVTTANRENLIRVERGEATERARTAAIAVDRKIEQFLPLLLQQYNYSGAIAELKNLLQSSELPIESSRRIRLLKDCCSAFDAWDRFDHVAAWDLLQSYMKLPEIQPLGMFLKKVIGSRVEIDEQFTATDGKKGHGYEIVQDLLLNAERRAVQERYDDSVGRLYRALELLAQIRLYHALDIKTGDVDLQKLPESLRTDPLLRPNDGKIQLALTQSYTLLTKIPDEPLGIAYKQQAAKIQNALRIRNYSLFAHGFQPINKIDYQNFSSVVVSFIQTSIATLVPQKIQSQLMQFPQILNI